MERDFASRSLLAAALLTAGLLLEPVPGSAANLFYDGFDYPNGVITTERGSPSNPRWQVTSGILHADKGEAWSNSNVFRVITRRRDFSSVAVRFRLRNRGPSSRSGESWHGVHVFLRYRSQYHLYAVTVNRRDNKVVIKKKVPGGPSNGGSYHDLGSASYRVPYDAWRNVQAVARNNDDGSVALELYVDGRLLVRGRDAGKGGPPIRSGGAVGVRGDFMNFRFDDFRVDTLDGVPPSRVSFPSEPSPPGGGAQAPQEGEARAAERFLSPSLADGVNDAAAFGPEAAEVTVFDTGGREIYQASRGSMGGDLAWNARDSSGSVVESGIYIVRIRTHAGETLYQSMAVVK